MSTVTLGGNPVNVAGNFPKAGDAAPVREEQRLLVVDGDEARGIAARRGIHAVGTACREDGERRSRDERAVMRVDVADLFRDRRPGRLAVNLLERRNVRNPMFFDVNVHDVPGG